MEGQLTWHIAGFSEGIMWSHLVTPGHYSGGEIFMRQDMEKIAQPTLWRGNVGRHTQEEEEPCKDEDGG